MGGFTERRWVVVASFQERMQWHSQGARKAPSLKTVCEMLEVGRVLLAEGRDLVAAVVPLIQRNFETIPEEDYTGPPRPPQSVTDGLDALKQHRTPNPTRTHTKNGPVAQWTVLAFDGNDVATNPYHERDEALGCGGGIGRMVPGKLGSQSCPDIHSLLDLY